MEDGDGRWAGRRDEAGRDEAGREEAGTGGGRGWARGDGGGQDGEGRAGRGRGCGRASVMQRVHQSVPGLPQPAEHRCSSPKVLSLFGDGIGASRVSMFLRLSTSLYTISNSGSRAGK